MKDLLRLFTPPEWSEWRWLARIAYLAIFWGLMIPVIIFAHWFSETLFPG